MAASASIVSLSLGNDPCRGGGRQADTLCALQRLQPVCFKVQELQGMLLHARGGVGPARAPRTAEEALLPERALLPEEALLPERAMEAEEPQAEEAIAGPSWAFPATSSSSPFPSSSSSSSSAPIPFPTPSSSSSSSSSSAPFPSSSSSTSSSSSSSSAPSSSSSSSSYTPKSTTSNRVRLQEKKAEAARRGETLSPVSDQVVLPQWLRQIKETGHRLLVKASGERVSYCPAPAGGKSPEEWLDPLP
ncbi:hypothetical protein NQZ68_012772 [Dissostichus eleginoides]|nr:hypothetical protein NQZ68_012772 [Dissostichus eleginoides]